jgi:type IV pilus assembly protein PilA
MDWEPEGEAGADMGVGVGENDVYAIEAAQQARRKTFRGPVIVPGIFVFTFEMRTPTSPAPLAPVRLRRMRGAFTLVEIMVVVVIIGLLASVALPAFKRVQRSAIAKRYINDARQIRDGAERYAMEHGNFPPNGIAGLHASLQGYIPDTLFNATTTPLGGIWDWDYQQNGITAAISVYQFTATDELLREIDRTIDDGDLTTGLFRKAGGKAIYVIQP